MSLRYVIGFKFWGQNEHGLISPLIPIRVVKKDAIEVQTEYASQKFKRCEDYEETLAHEFHQKLCVEREQWKNKIATLEMQMQSENHRNFEKRTELCSTIDVNLNFLLLL